MWLTILHLPWVYPLIGRSWISSEILDPEIMANPTTSLTSVPTSRCTHLPSLRDSGPMLLVTSD